MTKTKPSSTFLKTTCTKLLDIRTSLISLRIGTNDHDPDSMAKKEAIKHLKPVTWGKLTEERPINSDELVEAIAQIKTFENSLITRNINQLFARRTGKEFSLTPNSQSASMMVHTYQTNPTELEETLESPTQEAQQNEMVQPVNTPVCKNGREGFPSGTEMRNSHENLTTLIPGGESCSE